MIKFGSDGVKIAGPKVDGSYSVTFNAGEYEAVNVAKLLAYAKESVVVTVELANEKKVHEVIGG